MKSSLFNSSPCTLVEIDLRTQNSLENDKKSLDCNDVFQEEIQNVMETIGTDFYGLAKFAQSCSKKVKVLDLSPCPVAPVDDFSIDFGSEEELIPGNYYHS